MQVHIISNITKEYPDMIKVYIYKEPRIYYREEEVARKRQREEVDNKHYTPKVSSLSRTKSLIKDLVLANNFELFCTFTFDPKKVNRYSYSSCYGKMSRWLHHQKTRNCNFQYLVVPEQHKDGAWHFHALISHYSGSLSDSGYLSSSGRHIYNMTSYRSGFSTAVPIDSKDAVSSYVTKYITKDFIKKFNQRRFTCSRNLNRPIKTTNSSIFRRSLPIFRRKVADFGDVEEFNLDKSCLAC